MVALNAAEAFADAEAERLERERREVTAAILLVAGGRYPLVTITSLTDARFVAEDLAAFASARRVLVELVGGPDDLGSDLVVRRP